MEHSDANWGGTDGHKSGYVTLVGRPNVGKSTLLNALLGQKLSIVTKKPQTTRHRVLGILSGDGYQVIFLDTPGVIDPQYGLHRAMMRAVDSAVSDADLLLFLVDATKPREDPFMLERLRSRQAILVINKVDLIAQKDVLPLAAHYDEAYDFKEIVPVSAKTGHNVDRLRELVVGLMPAGPPYYPPEMISEQPERFFVSELIREQIFKQYRQEIPYSTQVNIVAYEARQPPDKDLIDAEIVVERETQKGILIGKGGSSLKRLGTYARKEIEDFLGRPVFLRLFVKVRGDWRNREGFLRSFGYE
ncbi:MAG: GTPase Era [Bacteroidota bacterium]